MTSRIKNEDDFDDLKYSNDRPGSPAVSNEYIDSTRWFEIWKIVWREGDTFYAYDYEVPATEMQEVDEEFDPSRIYEVEPYTVTVTKYRKK